jgi:hypothetical protein
MLIAVLVVGLTLSTILRQAEDEILFKLNLRFPNEPFVVKTTTLQTIQYCPIQCDVPPCCTSANETRQTIVAITYYHADNPLRLFEAEVFMPVRLGSTHLNEEIYEVYGRPSEEAMNYIWCAEITRWNRMMREQLGC